MAFSFYRKMVMFFWNKFDIQEDFIKVINEDAFSQRNSSLLIFIYR